MDPNFDHQDADADRSRSSSSQSSQNDEQQEDFNGIESGSDIDESEEDNQDVEFESDEEEREDNTGSESEQSEQEDEMDDTTFLRDVLRRWAAHGGAASMRKLDELLRNLAVRFERLPLSYKTLLRTPRRIEVAPLNHGSILWYKGIRETLDSMDLDNYLLRYNRIEIDINMDGLELSKSSALKFWPILGYLVGSENPPFTIALYLGKKDPDDVYAYLTNLVVELASLQENGYIRNGIIYPFSVRNFILDAPARALVKCCVLFNSHCSCEKCCVRGEWIADRMTYCDLDAEPRTDASYNNQEQAEHHMGISPLQEIGTQMVSQFRLDPLHLVYLGVFKRLMQLWLVGVGNFRLHWTVVNAISDQLMTLAASLPCDFNRCIRELKYFAKFKATELRRICHYDSILIFRDHLNREVYRNFLLLYTALFILAHPVFARTQDWRTYAHELIVAFIRHSIQLYGEQFVVYNVHSLIHLSAECESQNSPLDDFSAFKFETFLATLKKLLKSFYRPCQQAACRISERLTFIQDVKLPPPPDQLNITLSMGYINEDEGALPGQHFRKIDIGNFVLQLNGKDNCFKTRAEDIVVLSDIVQNLDGTIYLVGNCFLQKSDFFEYPLPSSQLGIFSVANLGEETNVFEIHEVVAKCWLMPDGNSYCCVPILHTCSE